MAKKGKKAQQGMFFDLPGEPEPEPEPVSTEIIPFEFEGVEVRARSDDGEIWFVAAGVCQALDIANPRDAVSRLDDDEKGVATTDTLGGSQEMAIISEPGMWKVVLTSRKPKAKRFLRWITHDVIPSLRKKGYYVLPSSRSAQIRKEARRLHSDEKTAELRLDSKAINKGSHGRLKKDGASPNDYAAWHNAAYDAQFHATCADLRKALGLTKHRTPLDFMDKVVIAPNNHAKVLAERIIEDAKAAGRPISVDAQPAVLHQILGQFAANDLKRLGPGYAYGVRDDDHRGKIIDAIRKITDDRPRQTA